MSDSGNALACGSDIDGWSLGHSATFYICLIG